MTLRGTVLGRSMILSFFTMHFLPEKTAGILYFRIIIDDYDYFDDDYLFPNSANHAPFRGREE